MAGGFDAEWVASLSSVRERDVPEIPMLIERSHLSLKQVA
jgi:hypothetical protein